MPYVPQHTGDGHLSTPRTILLEAAARADEAAVLRALEDGAEIHVEDAAGRTVIGCAIAGQKWQDADASDPTFNLEKRTRILTTLLRHERTLCYDLNAPMKGMHGVTPLGLASWLNIPSAVDVLLHQCPGLVSVDGMDALGATPLMYAARDGRVKVVHQLLESGARPDFRDINHRSSIQYALKHPQVLWLCESALRRHRALEPQSDRYTISEQPSSNAPRSSISISCHPRLALNPSHHDLLATVNVLCSYVRTGDVDNLSSLLFPSSPSPTGTTSTPLYLVNYPDSHGWSAIHYCMTMDTPSTEILDILYKAGADVSLYTRSNHGTPLHCLARRTTTSLGSPIHRFINHFVTDLHAPLSATDSENESCIHVAAEHGHCIEVLMALLACDTTGAVREIRNARGLTAMEVAKPHFKVAFGAIAEQHRSTSSASNKTIKPLQSPPPSADPFNAVRSVHLRPPSAARHSPIPPLIAQPSLTDDQCDALTSSILENLQSSCSHLTEDPEIVDVAVIESLLRQTSEMAEDFLTHFQNRLHDASEDLMGVRSRYTVTSVALEETTTLVETQYGGRLTALDCAWDGPGSHRRRTTDSSDSDATAVSTSSYITATSSTDIVSSITLPHIVTDCPEDDCPEGDTARALKVPFSASTVRTSFSLAEKSLRPVRSMVDLGKTLEEGSHEERGFRGFWVKEKELSRRRSKGDLQEQQDSKRSSVIYRPEKPELAKTGISKVKAWFMKKLAPEASHNKSAEQSERAGGEEKRKPDESASPGTVREDDEQEAVYSAWRITRTLSRDMKGAQECIDNAERYITHAHRSVAQAGQLLHKMLEERRNRLEHASLVQEITSMDLVVEDARPMSYNFPPVTIPTSVRDSQLVFPKPPSSASSSQSSLVSFSTLIEGDDEDMRALRRLLTRKIEARTDRAFDAIDKATTWIRVIKDVSRTLKQRTRQ